MDDSEFTAVEFQACRCGGAGIQTARLSAPAHKKVQASELYKKLLGRCALVVIAVRISNLMAVTNRRRSGWTLMIHRRS